jgi:hypothetical protein
MRKLRAAWVRLGGWWRRERRERELREELEAHFQMHVEDNMRAGMSHASLLKTMLFGVGTHDAATFATVPLVLASVALLAAYLPARRASRMPPVDALRAD